MDPAAATQLVVTAGAARQRRRGERFRPSCRHGRGWLRQRRSGPIKTASRWPWAASPAGATVGGTLMATARGAGVATFTGLTLDQATAGYSFQASSGDLNASATSLLTVERRGAPANATGRD